LKVFLCGIAGKCKKKFAVIRDFNFLRYAVLTVLHAVLRGKSVKSTVLRDSFGTAEKNFVLKDASN